MKQEIYMKTSDDNKVIAINEERNDVGEVQGVYCECIAGTVIEASAFANMVKSKFVKAARAEAKASNLSLRETHRMFLRLE